MESLENTRIESDRLIMIPAIQDYAEEIFDALDDSITQHLSFSTPKDISETETFLRSNEESVKNGTGINFSVWDENNFVATCSVTKLNTESPELGIWLTNEYQGKGYGQEIMISLINWVFNNFSFKSLDYKVKDENKASIRLSEKLGAVLHKGPFPEKQPKGEVFNVYLFKIYRKNFYNS